MTLANFIETATPSDHAVQVYDRIDDLAELVGRYLEAGFAIGSPAIVIATEEHRERFSRELEARSLEPGVLEREGLLTYRDAEETLNAVMDDGLPSAERFEGTVGILLEEAAARFPGATIRAFGEMVDLLWRRGEEHAAIALEELWNELARQQPFALLCGYRLDIFDVDVQRSALPDVFRVHNHACLAIDNPRLAAAVDRALTEVVGVSRAGHIYLAVAEHVPRGPVPRAQAVLAWLSAEDPLLAERILQRVRSHYAAAATVQAAS
jgi:DcmR-like sensory protein